MLKIKEYRFVPSKDGKNMTKEYIDLKELEKYGFSYWKLAKVWVKSGRQQYSDDIATYYVTEERELQINTYNGDYTLDDVVYDLIKADIVVKE